MEKSRIGLVIVVCATFLGGTGLAGADEPGPTAHHARKTKKKARAPKASLTCKEDADCAFTPYADGGCWPTLCQQRAVAKTSADALEKFALSCARPNGRECPQLSCAPSPTSRTPACVSGKCVARAAPPPARE